MKDPVTFLLNLFGYEYNKPSLLKMYMCDVTHGTWMEDLQRKNQVSDYQYRIYTEV
jgi:hypothetical protein